MGEMQSDERDYRTNLKNVQAPLDDMNLKRIYVIFNEYVITAITRYKTRAMGQPTE
jgi:hypothetical protein